MTADRVEELAISQRLERLADEAETDTVTLKWVLEQLHESAFGLFLLILALPCCIPFLWGLPQVVSVPLMFIAGQIVVGRDTPWLPERLAMREVSKESLAALAERAGPWLRRIEAISHPRLGLLTRAPMDRIVGLAVVIFCASILLPIPLTNTVPGIAVVIVAMGLLQRDGLLVLLGMVAGLAWIGALIFAGASLTSLIFGWLGW